MQKLEFHLLGTFEITFCVWKASHPVETEISPSCLSEQLGIHY